MREINTKYKSKRDLLVSKQGSFKASDLLVSDCKEANEGKAKQIEQAQHLFKGKSQRNLFEGLKFIANQSEAINMNQPPPDGQQSSEFNFIDEGLKKMRSQFLIVPEE